ncbi:MAG: hypothetical protein VXZ35_09065 [Pseudomonadota bacterium]|nr:hypothetical protein [Pseudomonadota bacterium]
MRCANTKLEIPEKYFKYKKLNFQGTKQVVPDFYIKYVEPTNSEIQKTDEKGWSFKEKMYECTQKKIQELRDANIKITPNDFEWVIDFYEKCAVNKEKSLTPTYLINLFKEKCPDEQVKQRVSDDVMKKVYDIWKTQREKRSNRSFIRFFWHYQDNVNLDDNYATFQTTLANKKQNLRCNIKTRMNSYAGMFIERENAVILSDLVSHMHQKTLLQLDVSKIEDDEFDKLIGKSS